ncbi:M23 family metallopeptidase [Novosphingobium bradum]|uniref:M23 family metallopeptidase n=1 Tax=Novosphingobium bradum TaxID=1737444 RepID=A0ABV7IR16_9SPHN
MFRPHDQELPLGRAVAATAPCAAAAPPAASPTLAAFSPAVPSWRARLAALRLDTSDWVVDLAEAIGSPSWWRGMATMAGLALSALAFWPGASRLEAAPGTRAPDAASAEWRSLGAVPLSFDTTRLQRAVRSPAVRPVAFVAERPQVSFTSTLATGDDLAALLQRAGAAGADATRASALVAEAVPLDQLAAGTRVALVLGPRLGPGQPRRLDRIELRARLDLALAVDRAGGGLALERRPIPVDTTPLRIRGLVGASLYRSARAAGAPPQAIQDYLQALDANISLDSDVLPTDSFDLVFANKRAATGEIEPGELLYAGLDRGAQPVAQLLRWGHDGAFYSADALARPRYVTSGREGGYDGGAMLTPVNGRITSLYGQRFHPILGYARMHAGVDFGAAWGSPIVATAAGVVSFAGHHGGHGNYVRLEHGGGLGTGYGHMSRIAVSPGERVSAGEVIGYVGSTGLSTGPHLHYEMYRDGRTVNPLGQRFAAVTVTRQVDSGQLEAFRAKLAQLRAIRPGPALAALGQTIHRLALR